MSLRTQYLIFVLVLHGLFFLLSLQFLPENPLYFFLIETVILLSVGFSIRLFRSFFAPLDLIINGIEAIKAKDFNTKLNRVGQLEMDELISVYNQMIEQMRLERVKQQEQQFFLDKLIEASPAGIVILEFDGNIRSMNPTASRILGSSDKTRIGEPLAIPGDEFSLQLAQLSAGDTLTLAKSNGRTYRCQKSHFIDRGYQRQFLLLVELTEELLKREKQIYGKIIRFMSHEISNSIGAINSILHSVLNYKNQLADGDAEDFSEVVDVAINRNEHLNQFMQNYAQIVRLPAPAKEKHDLHEVLHSMTKLFTTQCEECHIDLVWNLDHEPLICEFDLQQMEQALMNILKNALEAIGEQGRISINTLNRPGKVLSICDSGSGFSDSDRSRLFTPFFSTKKNGQGVGLIMIRDILTNHDFGFSLQRIDPQTTEFRINFT